MKTTHMTNFTQAELDQFDAIAPQWWDANGPVKTLHHINPARLSFITEHTTLDKKMVLDVGCGGGILAEGMARAGANVSGIDLAKSLLDVADMHATSEKLKIKYTTISAETYATKHAGKFDMVTCMEMLEHVPDPQSIVTACAALTKPGGHLFFSTINRNAASFAQMILGAEYVLRLLPTGTHHYDKFLKPSELASLTRAAGLTPEHTQGMRYNPLNHQATLVDNVKVNYLLHCVKPTSKRKPGV
jgi:2-polyprenyl-6-hydroxyphenyl methylase/3-demethylubiquinone-9 3-methyltransferase